jgi:hypothetical protein
VVVESAGTVLLVEGESDRCALETLAGRLGRDLASEGVAVVAMGGATNVARHLAVFGPVGRDLRLGGLCDSAESGWFLRVVARAGVDGSGFFVCVEDLEDELIRALGPARVEAVIAREGELRSLRTLQHQPAHRSRPAERQLRRFIGSHSGRKLQYARALVEALELDEVPPPLASLLAFA